VKKVFIILSLALGALSVIFGIIYAVMLLIELNEKTKAEREVALEKVKSYVSKKLSLGQEKAQELAGTVDHAF